jgi:DNA-binding response OmpR family regulator
MNISYAFSPTVERTRTDFSAGKHILIVDDQETILIFLRDRLEQLGFAIFTASNGAEALALLQKDSFQGILLDLEIPGMDGLSMLNQLRKQSNAIPVIVMSADPTRTAMIKAIEAGARDYLTKPISYEILKYKCLRLFA